ncbi:Genetic suppressor element 1, partial [Xenoophorus captivus]
LTRGPVGPAGNVWVRRGASPRRKVAPQSLLTSWETPMPSVSPLVLSCRIHGFRLLMPPGAVPEEYIRSFRPYATTEDPLRMQSLPLGLDPAAAAAAAAYYHPSYLPHPSFTPYRMDDPFCLSALRSPFYPLPTGGALPPIHPSAVHMHLPGVRYPGDFAHPSLSALQSER